MGIAIRTAVLSKCSLLDKLRVVTLLEFADIGHVQCQLTDNALFDHDVAARSQIRTSKEIFFNVGLAEPGL